MTRNNKFNEKAAKAIITFVFLILLVCLGALQGCKPSSKASTHKVYEKDSIHTSVNFIKRDTTIVVPGDTLNLRVPIYNLSEVPLTIRTSNGLNLSLSKINDDILAACNTDDLKMIIELQDKLIKEYKSNKKEEAERIEIPVKYIPQWVMYLAIFGGVSIVFFGFKISRSFV